MRVDDFDFDLPNERIALRPARPRDAARMLHVAGDAIRDWLICEARLSGDGDHVFAQFCEKLVEAGVPIDRATVTVTTLHAELSAVARFWVRGEPVRREAFAYRPGSREQYERSPFFRARTARSAGAHPRGRDRRKGGRAFFSSSAGNRIALGRRDSPDSRSGRRVQGTARAVD